MIKTNRLLFLSTISLGITIFSGLTLSSPPTHADDADVVDEINLKVPISCTLTGTGMDTHNASLYNGQLNSAIGETTLRAFCNDNEGFAIYAIGYTDDTDGKNVLTDSSLDATNDIVTGTATGPVGNVDTSNWAMKVSTVSSPSPTYPIVIQNSYDSFHAVPNAYEMVAKRTTATDIGTNAEGSILKTTYQTYISNTQLAGTYTGQVKYTLVHPHYVDENAMRDAVTVVYNGNGLTFPDGSSTNIVKYANITAPGEYAYVGNTYQEVMTSNILPGGIQDGAYTNSESILQVKTLPNADKVKVIIDYEVSGDTTYMTIAEGSWGGWEDSDPPENNIDIYPSGNASGQIEYVFDGDTITIDSSSWETPESGYDYGFYVKIYPVYDTEQPNTTYELLPGEEYNGTTISGEYSETTTWKGSWYITENEEKYYFYSEYDVIWYIQDNYDSLKGTTIAVYANNPIRFQDVYADANKPQYNGYYAIQDLDYSMCSDVDTIGQAYRVRDVRDDDLYYIAKLKDGNCWLIDNLRLDPTDSTTAANLSTSNTNATAAAIANYLQGGNNGNVGGWSSTPVGTINKTFYNSYDVPLIYPSRKNSYGDGGTGQGSRKVGVYYNYCAATVGTYCYSDSNGVDTENTLIDAPYDLCPANWRMPTGGSEGEYKALDEYYEDRDSRAYAISATRSGTISYTEGGSMLYFNTESGYYWSSTYNDVAKMYELRTLYNGSWYFLNEEKSRTSLYPVRCLVAH